MDDAGANIAIEALEREKLRLETEKLAYELLTIRRTKFVDAIVRLTPLVTLIIAVGGFALSYSQIRQGAVQLRQSSNEWNHRLDTERTDRGDRLASENENNRRDSLRSFTGQRLTIYMKALSDAAVMTTAKNSNTRQKASEDFLRLYTGPMIFVEDKEVSKAMVKFWTEYQKESSGEGANSRAVMALGTAMRLSYFDLLKMKPEEVLKRQENYLPTQE